ncbi:MAG TPA: DUF1598 domain-containing protein [Planctomycetaceae bacterium]|nr:DUF1598 domain-containing protein [Planctomycetaceae bacterium]
MRRALFIIFLVLITVTAFAQQQPGGGNNNNQNNNAGIKIDARGIVAPGFTADSSSKLDKKRRQALASKTLSEDLNRPSECRKVSLVALEQAVAQALEKGEKLTDELRCLAGLQRVDFLFVDLESKDLILAGPADGFAPDAAGRMRGLESGRPTLLLDDLIVAWRFATKTSEVGCSIDPRPKNLAALQQYLAQNSSAASASVVEARYRKMAEVMGMHDIRVEGVPAESHFGRVLVEADYRMKRISLGLENPGVKGLISHLAMLKGGGNSIQRWWFVPLYDGLYRSDDRLAFQLVGQRAQLLSQDELANASGERFAAATTKLTTQAFSKLFTEKYEALVEESPVFAELQNLIDWCVLTALIERERLVEKIEWNPGVLADAEKLRHEVGPVPKEVPAMVNIKRVSGSSIIGLIAGGVTIHPGKMVSPQAIKTDPALRLDSQRADALPKDRPTAERWWWD